MRHFDKFPLAKPGWPYVAGSLALAGVATALHVWWLAAPLWLAAAFCLWFFRDPPRRHDAGPKELVSPADGKVVEVREVDHPGFPGGRCRMVSVFMDVTDVHVNRAPCDGVVEAVTRRRGGFEPAWRESARVGNECVDTLLLAADGQPVLVAQVAGLVARRIHCDALPGDPLQKGQRFGMIRFGSRVDVHLDVSAAIRVKLGDRVKAGVTVIGEFA